MPVSVPIDMALLATASKGHTKERRIDFVAGGEPLGGRAAAHKNHKNKNKNHNHQQQQQENHHHNQQQLQKKQKCDVRPDRPAALQHAVALSWKTASRVGPGLVNLGNTCFLNSVLQCLTHTPPLAEALLGNTHRRSCPLKSRFCVMCALESHVQICLRQAPQKSISPRLFVDNLRRISRQLRLGRQEDAHEFARFLIEGLQKSESVSANCKPDATLANKVFGGALRSRIRCLKCKATSDTIDPIMDISLDIKHCQNLTQAFARFTEPELLNKQNQYRCSKCNALRDAHKQITILRPPTVLTVQLKRFGFMHTMGAKISRPIAFDPQLRIDPFMAKSGSSATIYDLCAVLVHSGGSCHSGHYYSFVKAPNNTWYAMDDSRVSPVSMQTVLSQQAYILFYTNRSLAKPSVTATPATVASCAEKPVRPLAVPRQATSTMVSGTPQRVAPKTLEVKVSPGLIPVEVDRKPKRATAQDFFGSPPKSPINNTVDDVKEKPIANGTCANGSPKQNPQSDDNCTKPTQELSPVNSVSNSPTKKIEPKRASSYNSTQSWTVVTKHIEHDGSSTQKTQARATMPWVAPAKPADVVPLMWEDMDENMLNKRRALMEMQNLDAKLKRPSRDEVEYDRPKVAKKRRKEQFGQQFQTWDTQPLKNGGFGGQARRGSLPPNHHRHHHKGNNAQFNNFRSK